MLIQQRAVIILCVLTGLVFLPAQARSQDRQHDRFDAQASGDRVRRPGQGIPAALPVPADRSRTIRTHEEGKPPQAPPRVHTAPMPQQGSPALPMRSTALPQQVLRQQVTPRVYGVPENRSAAQRRGAGVQPFLADKDRRVDGHPGPFHRRHQGNWHPQYTFYEDTYHFYPYVNIIPVVTLSSGYVAVPPPMGIVVPTIRTTQYQHIVDGEIYYAHNGVYYQPVAGGYKVVGVVQD